MPLLRDVRWRRACRAILLASGAFAGMLSCGGAEVTTQDGERAASIRIQPDVVETLPNASVQLTANVLNLSGAVLPNAQLLWTTSDAKIVTVDASGLIRAQAVGTAQVGAQYGSLSASVSVNVRGMEPPTVETIEFESLPSLEVGSMKQLQAVARDKNGNALADRAVTFSTSNPDVATTSASGFLQAVGVGITQITAAAEGRQTSRAITITPASVVSVSLSPTQLDLVVGASGTVVATAFGAGGVQLSGRPVTFASNDPTVASVDGGGVVAAKMPGTTVITAIVGGIAARTTVVVTPGVTSPSGIDIVVSSPVDISAFHIAVDGPGLAAPTTLSQQSATGRRTATVHVLVPPGGPYRVRVIGGATQGGEAEVYVATTGMAPAVIVPPNGFASVTIATSRPTVSFAAPSTVNVNDPVDITWTVVDAGGAFDRAGGPAGRLWRSVNIRSGDAGGFPVTATATKLNATTYSYTARFSAPTFAAKIYYQFESMTWDPASPVWGQTGRLFTPVLNYGDSAYTIAVQQQPSPIRLTITSAIPTNEYVIVIDGGPLGTSQTVNGINGNMITSGTATIGLPPGGPYRIRVLSPSRLGPSYTAPVVTETGVLRNVTVVAGVPQNLSLSLGAPSVAITIPATSKLGQPLDVSWTYSDPGEALDLIGGPVGLIQYSDVSGSDFVGTLQSVPGVRLNATTYQFSARIPTASTTGKLFYHVGAQVINMPILPLSRVGWYLNPSQVRLETVPFITLTP